MLTPRRVSILSVPSMNLVCIKSHNPHSSPYSAVRLQLPSRSRHVYCHTPPPSTMYIAVLPCRICYVVPHRTEAWNSLQRMTTVLNRPILHWPLTHYYTTCMFPANFMHYTESDDQKLGGPIHCWSPQPKSCLPQSPWLLRLWIQALFQRITNR